MYTEEQHEAYLNDLYSMGMSWETVRNNLIYLTNPDRGPHISEVRLQSAYHNGTIGTILKDYDSLAFTVSYNEVEG